MACPPVCPGVVNSYTGIPSHTRIPQLMNFSNQSSLISSLAALLRGGGKESGQEGVCSCLIPQSRDYSDRTGPKSKSEGLIR